MTASCDEPREHSIECAFLPSLEADDCASERHVLGQVVFQHESAWPTLSGGAPRIGVHMVAGDDEPFTEVWLTGRSVRSGAVGDLVYAEDGEYLFCAVRVDERATYRDPIYGAYSAAFELIHELGYPNIFRMWNLVGQITQDNAEGMENYRDFCVGRAKAFDEWSSLIGRIPAATGIGSRSGGVDFYFLACRDGHLQHVENPQQTPAYHYPARYSPKSPNFARATYLSRAGQHAGNALFVSGTASILGAETVHVGDIDGQCEVMIDNVARLISRDNLRRHGIDDGYEIKDLNFIKVYVRDEMDLSTVRAKCANWFPGDTDIAFLNVDICRSDLLVEIEGICTKAA